MRFWTQEEARAFSPGAQFSGQPSRDEVADWRRLRVDHSELAWQRLPGLLGAVIEAVGPATWWLVWMDEGPSQWSGGNVHLYYRLRQSYGDLRLLHEAPCHLLLQREHADLFSILQVGAANLWDIHVVTDLEYGRLFVSHDGWLEVSGIDLGSLDAWLRSGGIAFDEPTRISE